MQPSVILHSIAGCASLVGAIDVERLARSFETSGLPDPAHGASRAPVHAAWREHVPEPGWPWSRSRRIIGVNPNRRRAAYAEYESARRALLTEVISMRSRLKRLLPFVLAGLAVAF